MNQLLLEAAAEGDVVSAAQVVSLRYVTADEPGIARLRRGKAFWYRHAGGARVRDRATLARIRTLAIPPAWTDVWISTDPDGHLQATGRDARGRKQYRYHARWRAVRDAAKYHRLVAFCGALPRLRRTVEKDLRCRCLCKRKVVAVVVALMESCQLRVGNDEYARDNGSFGATTLRDRHARFSGGELALCYRGKSGVERRARVTDRRLARIVRRCRDLPGQRLFQYVGEDGAPAPVTSTDVNAYLREASDGPFTAKDYRTWAATMAAALLLGAAGSCEDERSRKRCVNEVLALVAARLGHTVAVCRSAYVHPSLLEGFERGELDAALGASMKRLGRIADADALGVDALRAVEKAVARYLDRPVKAMLRGDARVLH